MKLFWKSRPHGLTVERLQRIDACCDRYETEWRAGRAPRIEEYLNGVEAPARGATWLELVMLDQELRRSRGESPTLGEYRASCPDVAIFLAVSTDLKPAAWTAQTVLRTPRREVTSVEVPDSCHTAEWIATPPNLATRGIQPDDPKVPERPRRAEDSSLPGLDSPFGDYELIERLGSGGMGVVFKARQVSLNRLVALKMIKDGVLAQERDIRLFRAESEAVAALDHPHIVPVLESDTHKGIPYYSMKLIAGTDLSQCIHSFRKQPRAIARLMVQIAGAIAHAHERGVLHRDIKPTNILIDEQGAPHIIDFGLARRQGVPLVTSLTRAGTPSYMAPEQVRGEREKITTATDVYGLGGLLYTLLTGRVPFNGPTPEMIARQVTDTDPVRPRDRDPHVDADLETICLRCLSKDPAGRYPSARDLADDLKRWLDGLPIVARPATRTERAKKWIRRHRLIALLSAAAIIGVMVGIGGLAWGFWMALAARDQAMADEDLARRHAYAAELNLAERDWRDVNLAEVDRHLNATRPPAGKSDLRGFEWSYLHRLSRSQGMKLDGHRGAVRDLAYSRDGRRLASVGDDRTIMLWDPATGQRTRSTTTKDVLFAVAFHPDGSRIASAGYDRDVTLRDVATGQVVRSSPGHTASIYDLAFAPDGKTFATSSRDGTVRIWDGHNATPLRTLADHPEDTMSWLAFAPDGKTLASAGGDASTIRLWEVATGKKLRAIEDVPAGPAGTGAPRPWKPMFIVKPVAFTPDGKILATGTEDGSIHFRDPGDGRLLRTFRNPHDHDHIVRLVFASNGKTMATAGYDGQGVSVWDVATGELIRILKINGKQINNLAFDPDGVHLAVACGDATVRILDTTRDQEFQTLSEDVATEAVAFGPDGSYLAVARWDGAIAIRNSQTGATERTFRGHTAAVLDLAISTDGRLAASASRDGTVRIWEVATGREVHTLAGHDGPVSTLAFAPDGKTLASGGADHMVQIWDPAEGRLLHTLAGHPFGISDLAFAPDGKTLFSADPDGTLIAWDPTVGAPLRSDHPHPGGIQAIAVSADGRTLATGGFDRTIRLHDLSGQGEPLILAGHAAPARALAFAPDGHRLASAGSDRTVRIWDPASGLEVMVLRGHSGGIWSLAFAPDGRRLASASIDHTVRIWTAEPEEVKPANATR